VAAVSVPLATAPAAGEPRAGGQSDGQYCTDVDGVTVVVDLGDLDPEAGVVVRCANGPTGSGYTGLDALTDAGIDYEMPVRQPGMVCRVLGRPSTAEQLPVDGDEDYVEPCVDAPPTAAYWSYWYAADDGRWQYSSAGPGNRDAIPGGFEGWSFSLNHTESTAPAPRVAPENPNAPYEDGGGDGDGGNGDGSGGGDGGNGDGSGNGDEGDGNGSGGGSGNGGSGGDGPTTVPPPSGSSDGTASSPAPTPAPDDQPVPGPSVDGPTTPAPGPDRDSRPSEPGPGGRDGDGVGSGGDAGRGDGEPRPRGDQDPGAGPGGGGAERTPGVSVTSDVPRATPAAPTGPPMSTMVGGAVLAVLAVLGAGLAWRRRARGTGAL